jgi:hypothetical protein
MRPHYRFASLSAIASILFIVPSSAQKTTGPKAQYTMDVSTASGFGMGGLGGMLGGGGGSTNTLDLRLSSSSSVPAPQQPEKGDHFFLPAAKMGKSVPLLGDGPRTAERGTSGRDYDPRQPMEKPKGRLLMFWGCHAKAPKGQPFIIDFAKMPTAQMPRMALPGNMEDYRRAAIGRNENAAWWPNEKGGKQPKSGSSLRGEHRIVSGFTPEIKFALANDYMAGFNVNNSDQAGSVLLGWNAISTATGYSAMAMGGMERAGQGGDMVMWTSANTRDFTGSSDWMTPTEVARHITAKNVMPPSQTSCNIPAEAKTAAGGMMFGNINAYGPEENFAFPPKPVNPKAVWNIDWTARVRFRAMSSFMIGMGGGGMGEGGLAQPERKPKPCKGPLGIPIPGTQC